MVYRRLIATSCARAPAGPLQGKLLAPGCGALKVECGDSKVGGVKQARVSRSGKRYIWLDVRERNRRLRIE